MTFNLNIMIAQINPVMGDLDGNTEIHLDAYRKGIAQKIDLVVFAEMSLIGYPPEDLIFKNSFHDTINLHLEILCRATKDKKVGMLLGAPYQDDKGDVYNAAYLIADGKIQDIAKKSKLPNYGVFDEKRNFNAANHVMPLQFKSCSLGVMICEDMWSDEVAAQLKEKGAEVLIVLNGSPFEIDKFSLRFLHAKSRVMETGLPLIYSNLYGGQDELVFDGHSFALNAKAEIVIECAEFEEVFCSFSLTDVKSKPPFKEKQMKSIYTALMIGIRDYVNKNGFKGVVIGLSGGVDSALTAVLAVDALGADRVHTIMMPSEFTSQESLEDAQECADALGVSYDIVSIEEMMNVFGHNIQDLLNGTPEGLVHENIQARLRGVILMAYSNKTGYMVLSTGNKSEMSVGYSTLYGDLCGGFSALKDVYKTLVYDLCTLRKEFIPQRILTKAPSAELRADQKDQDSLPEYEILDGILRGFIEREESVDEIAARIADRKTVLKVQSLLYMAEYKRRQSPPGVKITAKHFGRDRRYPITNKYRNQ